MGPRRAALGAELRAAAAVEATRAQRPKCGQGPERLLSAWWLCSCLETPAQCSGDSGRVAVGMVFASGTGVTQH